MNEKTESYTSEEVIYYSSPKVVMPLDKLKNLMGWTLASSVLQIFGSTLLGGTLFDQTLPLLFGSVGVLLIAVAILIQVIKFNMFFSSPKNGKRITITYCNVTEEETAQNKQPRQKESHVPVQT